MRRARLLQVALAGAAVLAGAPAARALTLEQCIELARRNAPALRVSEAGVSRAGQAIREARAALSPTLRVAGSAIERSESPKFIISVPGSPSPAVVKTGSATNVDVRAEARLPIDASGQSRALVRAAEAARKSQQRAAEEADADLVLRVSQAYYRVIAAGRLETAAGEAVQAAGARRRLAASQVRAGVAQRLDSLQARVDLFQRESALIRAHEAVQTSRVELETAIGTPIDSTETLEPPGSPDPAIPEAAALEATALRSRAQLAAFDEQLRENEQRIRAARAARGPTMGLSGTAQYLGPNRQEEFFNTQDPGLKTYNLWAGVDFSYSLFDGGLSSARAGELRADRAALEARRRQAELEVRRDVERSLSDLRVSLAIWQSDSSRVTAAREALRLAEAGYRGGTTTASQVRDAESALADARAQEAQSLLDTWSARAALLRAAGPATSTGGR
ncbi:MAG TPA: TolC family protein [Candidatus Eisenbacteria bacterium]|nr:TolC family protein [Candidatus Eisenbacteria bacterium]